MPDFKPRGSMLPRGQQLRLIEHIDGLRVFAVGDNQSMHAMVAAGLVRWCHTDGTDAYKSKCSRWRRPTHTRLTERGRRRLAECLADFADALKLAGVVLQVESMIAAALARAELTNATASPGEPIVC